MSIPANVNPLLLAADAATPSGFQVSRSLRFNASDSAYLSRTPAVAGNRRTWTWAGWVKKSALGENRDLFNATTNGSDTYFIRFASSDVLQVLAYNGSTALFSVYTLAFFRDVSAWYHIAVTLDTTQATDSNRLKLYVNGIQITAFGGAIYPALNTDYLWNSAVSHEIGRGYGPGEYLSGYLADIHFIDGQALTPSSFTEVSATTGQLIPKAYSGTYGTNGFYLKFDDNSTTAALGTDSSGNGNTWTTNNFSVTAGAGNDSLVDTPTSYGTDTGVGGEVRGNYCTLNPLDQAGITFSNGNLDTTGTGICKATFGLASGKWYWEQTVITKSDGANNPRGGVATASASLTNDLGAAATQWVMFMAGGSNGGKGYNASTITGSGSAFAANDVAMFAYDADAGKLWFGRNGTWITGDPAAGTTPFYSSVTAPVFPVLQEGSSSSISNYGARAFAYTAPSGFKALCDTNLSAPVVAKPNTLFDVVKYDGTGAAQTVSGLNFDSDFLWIKRRDGTNSHQLTDSVRGLTKYLFSDATLAEENRADQVTATSSTGFSLGSNGAVNASAGSYVAWAWDAGTSTVSNGSGSITSGSQVRANTSAGFSVVTYTGTGSNATVGHGLGVAPGFIIIKNRNSATNWRVYHSALGNTKAIFLSTQGTSDTSSVYWNNTSPTSTVFSIGSDDGVNGNGSGIVSYCFAPVAGYSSFGSYVGNGSSDGPMVWTGFRVRWLLWKRSDSGANSWVMIDAARNTYNVVNNELYANLSIAEGVFTWADFLSNGFKLRSADSAGNSSGATYIYAAFAESPFQYARAR